MYRLSIDEENERHRCFVCGKITNTDLGCIVMGNFKYHCKNCHEEWIRASNSIGKGLYKWKR